MTVTISPRRLMAALWMFTSIVLLLGYGREILYYTTGLSRRDLNLDWINLNAELSLGAWFSSCLLLLTSMLMFWTFSAEKKASVSTALGWCILSVGFLYLSVDEATRLHENLSRLTQGMEVPPIFGFRWVMFGLVGVAVAGIAFVPFLLRLPRRTALGLIVAGAVYVGGALGLEMLSAVVRHAQGGRTIAFVILTCVEETLEMVGILLAITTVVRHLSVELQSPALKLSSRPPAGHAA